MILAFPRALVAHVALVASLLAPIQDFDWAVQRSVQAIRNPVIEPLMRGLTAIGEPRNALAVLLAVACFGGPEGPAIVRRLLAVLAPVNVVVEVTRYTTQRVRPDNDSNPRNRSFPSGHAANAAALAFVLSRRWKRWWPAFWTLAILISFSRIYLNRHFLSDVLVGMAIGVAIGWLAMRLIPGWWKGWPQLDRARPARRK